MPSRPDFISCVFREIHMWKGETWQLALLSWVPALLGLMLWWIFSAGIVTGVPVGVVDLDDSALSRQFIRLLDASPALEVSARFLSPTEGRHAMSTASVAAVIIIPRDFQIRVRKGLKPDVTAFFNGQFILIGKAVKSALLGVQATMSGVIDGGMALARGAVMPEAEGKAAPIVPQLTPLFNPGMDYALFLVPAIIPALWQVLMMLGMLNAIGMERRKAAPDQWLAPGLFRAIAAKMFPLIVIYSAWGMAAFFFYRFLGWQIRGSWAILAAGVVLTAIATAVMAVFLYALVDDLPRSLSLAAAYTAPSFAFLGVTFPATDMPVPALLWRSLIPVCHYIDIQISQMSRAAPLDAVSPHLAALLFFLALFPLAGLMLERSRKTA